MDEDEMMSRAVNESRAMAASPIDTALDLCVESRKSLAEAIANLTQRLQPVLRPEPGNVPYDPLERSDKVETMSQPSPVVDALLLHVGDLQVHIDTIHSLTKRLDT